MAQKKKTNVRKKVVSKRLGSVKRRISTRNLLIFAIIFAIVAGYTIWRSYAATVIVVDYSNLNATSSHGETLVTESSKKTSVVQVSPYKVSKGINGRAVFTESIPAGVYKVCFVGEARVGTPQGTFVISKTIDGAAVASKSYTATNTKEYEKLGCTSVTQSTSGTLAFTVNVQPVGSTLRVSLVTLEKTANITATPPPTVNGNSWADHTGIFMTLSGGKDRAASIQRIDKAKALGVKWIKFSWEQNWGSFDDSLVTYAHSQGLKVVESCQKTPHTYTASDIQAYAAFCASWADRTGSARVDGIEIGNEWNNHNPFWSPSDTSYATQAAFFDATAAAIRAKPNSDSLIIISSGWSPEASPNLPQEATAKSLDRSNGNFKKYANGIGLHPYSYNCDSPLACGYPGRRDWNTMLAAQDVYNAAKARGFDHPLYFTEVGGPSSGGTNLYTKQSFTLASQKQLFIDYIAAINQLRSAGVPIGIVFWGTIQDGQNSTQPVEDSFGLYDANWNIKPAGQVVKDQSSKAW